MQKTSTTNLYGITVEIVEISTVNRFGMTVVKRTMNFPSKEVREEYCRRKREEDSKLYLDEEGKQWINPYFNF